MAGEQNRQPRHERRDPPRDSQQPDDNQLRDDQDQTKSDAEAPPRAFRSTNASDAGYASSPNGGYASCSSIRNASPAHAIGGRTPCTADRRDISAADHDREPGDDREHVRHRAEQAGFAAEGRARAPCRACRFEAAKPIPIPPMSSRCGIARMMRNATVSRLRLVCAGWTSIETGYGMRQS